MSAPLLIRVIALIAACLGPGARVFAARPWEIVDEPRFTILSQAGESDTRRWAGDFNAFVDEFRRFFKIDETQLPPLTVVIFDRVDDFSPYRPAQPDGRAAQWAGGMFGLRDTWGVIGVVRQRGGAESRRVVLHEGVHWMMNGNAGWVPLWLDEGLAEVFSTFELKGDRVRWGAAIDEHFRTLKHERLPLETLVNITRTNPLFNENSHTGTFYAESWAFAHYLLFGERDTPRNALGDFLSALQAGATNDAAFVKALGRDFHTMDGAFQTYIDRGRYFVASHTIVRRTHTVAPFRSAAPLEVELALARLAIGTNHPDLAAAHVRRALELDTSSVGALDLRALILQDAGDNAAALATSERAISLGSKDALTYVVAANSRWEDDRTAGAFSAGEARRVANMYERAINLRTRLRIAYENLSRVLVAVEPVKESDLRFLRAGNELFPDAGVIYLGLATVLSKRGDQESAASALARAKARPGSLTDTDRDAADQMQWRWMYDECRKRIDIFVRAGRYDDAVAVLDDVIPTSSEIAMRHSLSVYRRELYTSGRRAAARAAATEGRTAIGCNILEELLSHADMPPGVRADIERELRQMHGPAAALNSDQARN